MAVAASDRTSLAAFAEAALAASAGGVQAAAETLVAAAAGATRAELAVARTAEAGGDLRARAVQARSLVLAAEVEGSRLAAGEVAAAEQDETEDLPAALRRLCERAAARFALLVPAVVDGRVLASLELARSSGPFDEHERRLVRLAAAQLALAVRAEGLGTHAGPSRAAGLELVGEALAAGADERRTAEHVVRIATEATGARACLLWRAGDAEAPDLLVAHGPAAASAELDTVRELAVRALRGREALAVERILLAGGEEAASATLQLGQPPVGALQLLFAAGQGPDDGALGALTTFGARAAQALRAGRRTRELAQELERTQALLAVVAQAISQLSLAHTLRTAVERVSELLRVESLGIYLLEGGRLEPTAGQALVGPHAQVAERLFELLRGRFRARGLVVLEDTRRDASLRGTEDALEASAIEAALALPLASAGETIGLLAVYPPRGHVFGENELALLSALAAQLSVAVQNAKLHERAKQLGSELEQALTSERQAARQLGALYEISRSFAQTLSLETTLDAVARTLVDALGVDAAVIRMPDERSESGILQTIHVGDDRLGPPVQTIFSRPDRASLRRQLRSTYPLVLDTGAASLLGGSYQALAPFLEKGATAVVLPIATSAEVLASLSLVSLDPARPIDVDTLEAALSIAGQAALAIDNARLYQQQKDFADSMQRSLLPRARPEVPGLEIGDVYESSAQVDVGGDVYDYLELDDGRLAVVLGDVTGHGIDAAADMAMAKFVFRSLAREHPEPSDFLAHANDVVVGEIALGKFITMAYLTVDAERGVVRCASAGHPAPRLVLRGGEVRALEASGLALGVDAPQSYDAIEAPLPPGAAVVLFTDGVIESRRDGELYGVTRLDALLAARHELPAAELALAVLAECRRFGGGELSDDCAIVVIKRTP